MNNFAYLKKDSPFYQVFPRGCAPIKNWLIPSQAALEGSDETAVYMLDVEKCSKEQLNQIAEIISLKFGAPKADVMDEMRARGMPIRISQTTGCSSDCPAFL